MAAIDPAFAAVASDTTPGLLIWRIEQFQVKPTDPETYGTFYRGDSYIVLAKTETADGKLNYGVHFWLGGESSQDEKGVAARKTVELDDALHGAAVQYRETDGHESVEFLSLFKPQGGIQVLEGGIDSGFNHVEPDKYETRLMHVKGKRDVRTRQVELAAKSLNDGDAFILDKGLKLFLWMGSKANRYERAKAVQVMQQIYNSRGARPEQIVVNDDPENEEFWSTLGGTAADVQPAVPDEDADSHLGEVILYRISDADGELKVQEVDKKNGQITRDMLDTNDSFMLDTGAEVFAWIGKNATADEKKMATVRASEIIAKLGRPEWCRVTRVVEGAEPPTFKSLFYQWDPPRSFDFTHRSKGVATNIVQEEIDAAALHKNKPSASEAMIDDGTGTCKVWIIEGIEMSEYPEDKFGQFYGGDSYIVQYTYENKGSKAHILYFWLGRDSDTTERGSAAARVVELSRQLSEPSSQVRLVQGKEPPHFSAIFKGTMIVHNGGRNGQQDAESKPRLYHVKGSNALDTKAIEVPAAAENLNSGDCFVLTVPGGNVSLWLGKGSNDDEKTAARRASEALKSGDVVEITEGEEDDAFWEALGGKAEYPEAIPTGSAPQLARLFHVSDVTGALRVEEIVNYAQDDLLDDDVMILDTFSQVFVWVGSQATQNERDGALKIAQDYIKAANDGRDADTPIVEVESGKEPAIFTCNFTGWDASQSAAFVDPYEARMAELRKQQEEQQAKAAEAQEKAAQERAAAIAALEAKNSASATEEKEEAAAAEDAGSPQAPTAGAAAGGGDVRPFDMKMDLEELREAKPDKGISLVWTSKEKYLSDEDFQAVFKMSPAEFEKQPAWKRTQAKKTVGLF